MKKTFIFAMAALTVAVGCRKFKEDVKPYVDPLDDGNPVEITFNTNVVNVQTRASLTGLNESNDLYIHGLNRTRPGVGEIINAKAHMSRPADAAEGWSLAKGPMTFADGKTFFYSGTRDAYDFYGYYVADAAVVPETLTGYKIDVTIDGTQDILLGVADPAADITAPGVNTDVVTGVQDVYSAWSARRGVTPNLVFRHVLAQYKFEVKNRGTLPVVLQSVEITSKTKGELTVVNQAPSAEGAGDGLVQGLVIKQGDVDAKLKLNSSTFVAGGALLDPKGEGAEDDVMVDGVRLGPLQETPVELQGELMTFAGQDNKVVLRLVQKGMKDGEYRQITIPITLDEVLNHGTKTQEGYSYLVSLVVYSLEEVGITVTLLPWQDGGNVLLDQEVEAGKPGTGYEDEIYTDNNDADGGSDSSADTGNDDAGQA